MGGACAISDHVRGDGDPYYLAVFAVHAGLKSFGSAWAVEESLKSVPVFGGDVELRSDIRVCEQYLLRRIVPEGFEPWPDSRSRSVLQVRIGRFLPWNSRKYCGIFPRRPPVLPVLSVALRCVAQSYRSLS